MPVFERKEIRLLWALFSGETTHAELNSEIGFYEIFK